MFSKIFSIYEQNINDHLQGIFDKTLTKTITEDSQIIIFSDLHMGNGGKSDDFKKNAALFNSVIKDYYLNRNYTLVLNGDIEELQKFKIESIHKQWSETYTIFEDYHRQNKLIKLTGNHDDKTSAKTIPGGCKGEQAARFVTTRSNVPIFIFHGHQASFYYRYMNKLNSFLLRYIVNPIGIKNFSKKYRHEKKLRIEKRSYDFSRKNSLIAIIGHTHRPLFESLSRADSIHFSIEQLLRKYRKSDIEKRKQIAGHITELKTEYDKCLTSKPEYEPASLMYSKGIPVPCLFNTGCVIGKRGITGIEITTDKISLVHWFDSNVSSRFLFDSRFVPVQIPGKESIHRTVLREDSLDYISDSINLLSSPAESSQKDFLSSKSISSVPKQNLTVTC